MHTDGAFGEARAESVFTEADHRPLSICFRDRSVYVDDTHSSQRRIQSKVERRHQEGASEEGVFVPHHIPVVSHSSFLSYPLSLQENSLHSISDVRKVLLFALSRLPETGNELTIDFWKTCFSEVLLQNSVNRNVPLACSSSSHVTIRFGNERLGSVNRRQTLHTKECCQFLLL